MSELFCIFDSPQSLADINMELGDYLLKCPVKLLAALDKALISAQSTLLTKLPEKDQTTVVKLYLINVHMHYFVFSYFNNINKSMGY